jgi:hypothetical protein
MAREEQIDEGTTPDDRPEPVGPGDVGGATPPREDPETRSCEELEFLLDYYEKLLKEANEDLLEVKFYQVKKRNQLKGRIAAYKDLIRDTKLTMDAAGCK